MDLLRPPRLRAGDRVAALTLSWGGPGTFPHRYEAGKIQLQEAFGLDVVEMPMTLATPAEVAANPEARAADLHTALLDESIAGLIATIGGDDSIRMLPFVDLDVIRAHPKVFLGYSDSTITHMAFRRAGVTSFYGPSIMSGFAENTGLPDYLVEGVRRTVFEPDPPGTWEPNTDGWTVEHLDWSEPEHQSRARTLSPSDGWDWHGSRVARGPLVVGCIEVLDWLRGTEWFPPLAGSILALETSEEAPPPEVVTRFIRSLAATSALDGVRAVLLGRPGGSFINEEQRAAYAPALLLGLAEQGLTDLPVVTGLDFGHTDPMWTLAQGVEVVVDAGEHTISITESAVA